MRILYLASTKLFYRLNHSPAVVPRGASAENGK